MLNLYIFYLNMKNNDFYNRGITTKNIDDVQ